MEERGSDWDRAADFCAVLKAKAELNLRSAQALSPDPHFARAAINRFYYSALQAFACRATAEGAPTDEADEIYTFRRKGKFERSDGFQHGKVCRFAEKFVEKMAGDEKIEMAEDYLAFLKNWRTIADYYVRNDLNFAPRDVKSADEKAGFVFAAMTEGIGRGS